MSVLKCVECGGLVSELAHACPHCGCPIEAITAAQKTVIHPKFGRGHIINTSHTTVEVKFEKDGETKKFIKSALKDIFKFENTDYRESLLAHEAKKDMQYETELELQRVRAFYDECNELLADENRCGFKRLTEEEKDVFYEKSYRKVIGRGEEREYWTNDGKFLCEYSPFGLALLSFEQRNDERVVYIPKSFDGLRLIFIADSFADESFFYWDESDEAFWNEFSSRAKIYIPNSVRYIDDIYGIADKYEVTYEAESYVARVIKKTH